jgi:tRNA G18 (ribose-2'-O)-methylase SpoU
VPLFNFADHNDLLAHLPYSCPLIGVELDPSASSISAFRHPERACYVLGAEDNGLTPEVMKACHKLVQLPGEFSMNVSNAGTVVMYDRWLKQEMRAA